MFSKGHYELIANAINRELKQCKTYNTVIMKRVINDLCEVFAKDNPRFSREAFIEACWKEVL